MTPKAADLEILRKPLWKTGIDLSFQLSGHSLPKGSVRGPIPIVTGPDEDPFLRFDQDLMFGLDERAQQIIPRIVQIYQEHRYRHCLHPGEIVVVDNRRAVHGRSSFFPRFDGYDRFLVRSFGVIDKEKRQDIVGRPRRMIFAHES